LLSCSVSPIPIFSVEHIFSDEVSGEVALGFDFGQAVFSNLFNSSQSKRGYQVRLLGKYFFNPDGRADRIYSGIYADLKHGTSGAFPRVFLIGRDNITTRFSSGLVLGFKWVGKSRIVLDISGAIAKSYFFTRDMDSTSDIPDVTFSNFGLIFRASIGYRFPNNAKQKPKSSKRKKKRKKR